VTFETLGPAEDGPPFAEARAHFRRLLTAMRLFRPGQLAYGPLGWARADEGPWHPFQLGFPAEASPAAGWDLVGADAARWLLTPDEEPELRELVAVLAKPRRPGPPTWALRRFELGCERRLATEALSDYLLGLRALLDGDDDVGRASLSLRLAALCAEERERRAVQRRVELAFALERFVAGGGSSEAYVDAIGSESPLQLVGEVEDHLRALLRDLLCGYLDPHLTRTADDILLASGEPFEIKAHDTRDRGQTPGTAAAWRAADEREEDTGELDALPAGEAPDGDGEVEEDEPVSAAAEAGPDDAVTPSADWGFDDDAASYSAPV
jgi:hypothetical protein